MQENEKNGDLSPIESPKEINTYDVPPIPIGEIDERTQTFNTVRKKKRRKQIMHSCYFLTFL